MNEGPLIRIDRVYYRTGRWPNQIDYLVGFDYYIDNVRFDMHNCLTGNPVKDYSLGIPLSADGRPFNPKRLIKVKPGMKFKRKGAKLDRGVNASHALIAHMLNI